MFLVLDEINGIAANADFSHFLKGLVDTNGMAKDPVPLLLMLCGVEERRRQMIEKHQPIDRIFDVVEIEALSPREMEEFFGRAFQSAQREVARDALEALVRTSAGFPKIMHLVGDAAYWIDTDGRIDAQDANAAIVAAAEEVGKKCVDHQVYGALRSSDYRSILNKIAKRGPEAMTFIKSEVEKELSPSERGKFNNFLQKMKKLNVIRSGTIAGEYVFNVKMVRLYIWLQSLESLPRSANGGRASQR